VKVLGNADRVFLIAYAAGLAAYDVCAKQFGFSFWAWFVLRDVPGFTETATHFLLASYYVFLSVLALPLAGLLLRDVLRREYMSRNRRLLWLFACASFVPLVPIYVLMHAWWRRDEGPPLRLLLERLKWNFVLSPPAFCSRRISTRSLPGQIRR
jgi:hypothetical protein